MSKPAQDPGQSFSQRSWRQGLPGQSRSVVLIYICTFFYWIALYLYVPVLPVYAESLGASLTVVGIIVAAYAFPQVLLRIPLGIWADSLGRQKPLIIIGGAILAAGSMGLGFSPDPFFLAISRGMVGIGAAMWVVFPVYLVTFYSGDKVGQSLGRLNFVTGAALVSATLLGGIVADYQGEKTAFFAAAGIAFVSLISVLFAREDKVPREKTLSWEGFRKVAGRPLLLVVSLMGVLVFFAEFASVWGFVPVYAARLGASDTVLGILTMLVTLGAMIGSLGVSPMMKRWGYRWPIIAAALMLGLVLIAVPFIGSLFPLGTGLLIHGIGYGILSTQLMVLAIYNIAPQQRATAMGLFQGIYAIGMLLGPIVAGILSDKFGLPPVFYVGGILCLIIVGMAYLPVIPRGAGVAKSDRKIHH